MGCDIVIYSRKYLFGLTPAPDTELQKPLEFPVMTVRKTSFVMFLR